MRLKDEDDASYVGRINEESRQAHKQALATAKAYNDDLLSTITRKEGELVAAHGTLDRIRERLIGRIVLRQIARDRDGG